MLKDKINEYQKKEVYKKLGINRKTLYNWLNHKTTDTIFKYLELCQMFNIDPIKEMEEYKNSIDK